MITIPQRHRRTDRQTDGQLAMAIRVASRGKNARILHDSCPKNYENRPTIIFVIFA